MTRRHQLRLVHSQQHRRAARSIAEILDGSAPKAKLDLVVENDPLTVAAQAWIKLLFCWEQP
ncbi:hypothetical protein [Bradyrhizobium sp. Tv2a-2]|uniref:hypothetical protein n=1 Tax=Bradyrhizobium sp. Tv2a-2 TaxID=113395 RepID=UPI000466DF70|nr:hypothetical protein [Bradyrhizobium sp. Tv2a-2]